MVLSHQDSRHDVIRQTKTPQISPQIVQCICRLSFRVSPQIVAWIGHWPHFETFVPPAPYDFHWLQPCINLISSERVKRSCVIYINGGKIHPTQVRTTSSHQPHKWAKEWHWIYPIDEHFWVYCSCSIPIPSFSETCETPPPSLHHRRWCVLLLQFNFLPLGVFRSVK